MTYNAEGKRITSENLAGQVTTTAWDCCLAYSYNNRSELTNAVAAVDSNYRYAYGFDDIGNREASSEGGTNSVYTASQLNQYTSISDSAISASTRNSSSVAYDFCIYNPFRFSSEYMDDSLVLVYYNYRHYYPRHGSWTSRDPIEYEPFEKVHAIGTMMNSINVYRYCKNATLMSFDYLGLLRDCDAEQIMCYRLCWNTNPPWPIDKHKRGHHIYCTSKCLAEYMKCQAENEFETIASAIFECIDEAIKWVNDNKVLVGTLVVVGGVAYVVSTSGVGALILVPLL